MLAFVLYNIASWLYQGRDLSSAFDTLDHKILLHRLNHVFGISERALKWFESYLKDRSQTVIINKRKSKKSDLQFGVPQGSVLGPLLFVMYTTPLSNIIAHHQMLYHFYADDTQLYIGTDVSNFDKTKELTENCISDIQNWMIVNKLKMKERQKL